MLEREFWEDKLIGRKEVWSCWLLATVVRICAAVAVELANRKSAPHTVAAISADCSFKHARRSFAERDEEYDSTCEAEHRFAKTKHDPSRKLQADASNTLGF